LSITVAADGKVLMKCQAQCSTEDVVKELGLTFSDLFARNSSDREVNSRNKQPIPLRREVAAYDYRDQNGRLLYQTVRYQPKDFRQRRPDGNGGWIWNLTGVTPVLYRLTDLFEAEPGQTVYLCEGEKDADRLASLGLIATTTLGGAHRDWVPSYSDYLQNRNVVVLVDNDPPGKARGQIVTKALKGAAAHVRSLLLPGLPDKGDVSDWLDAGGTVEELERLAGEPEPELVSQDDDVVAAFPTEKLPPAFEALV
jgi:hypothetical protein